MNYDEIGKKSRKKPQPKENYAQIFREFKTFFFSKKSLRLEVKYTYVFKNDSEFLIAHVMKAEEKFKCKTY